MKEKQNMLNKENIEDILALTSTQEGILFHYLVDRHSKRYHLYLTIKIHGNVEINTFKNAWNSVASANGALRSVFRWKGLKNPVQVILKNHTLNIAYEDFSQLTDMDQRKRAIEKKKIDEQGQEFNLQQVPFNVYLYKLQENQFEMVLAFHHILLDGWSVGIILKEFFSAYENFSNGKKPEFSIKPRLKEFIRYHQAQDKNEQEKFWKKYLEGFDTFTGVTLPKSSKGEKGKVEVFKAQFPDSLWKNLNSFAKSNKVSLTTLLYSGWALLLQKYNNCDDVIFGTVVSGRPPCINGIENATGLFINTLPLRVDSKTSPTVLEMIKSINQVHIQREGFITTPLVDIKVYGGVKGSNELFDNIIVVENYPLDRALMEGEGTLQIKEYSMEESTNYDMTVSVTCNDTITIQYIYNDGMYEKLDIERLSKHYCNILNNIIRNPEAMCKDIEIMNEQETSQILFEFNNTKADYSLNKTLHQFFEEQVEKTPDNVAVIFKDDRLTYRQLNDKANQLSCHLRRNGVKADTIVGIMIERSIEMSIGILGILKAGGAYMPIDPNCPKDRLEYMIKDSNVSTIITTSRHQSKVRCDKLFLLDDEEAYAGEKENSIPLSSPNNLAYIIYTSGSTGEPKGVMIEHRAVVNRIYWMQKKYKLDERDVILQKTTYMFDVSVWELFWWSFSGAALCFLEPEKEKQPDKIIEEVERSQVTTMHFVPSMLNVFLEYLDSVKWVHRLKSLRQVFASGEALLPNHVEKFKSLLNENNGTRLINLYGPTEAAIDVSYFDCCDEVLYKVPIGKPIDNIILYVVDRNLKLQPIGIPGELYIAGDGLARGYINKLQLTSEKFIPNSFAEDNSFYKRSEERNLMYKTGDLVRWMPDGNIEYLGRLDNQVKVRGFRIELGEIESNMLEYVDVKEVSAILKEDENKDKYISMYYISEKELDIVEIKEFLGKRMPEYMIPTVFIPMSSFPLTSNGKLDTKALSKFEDTSKNREHIYVKPENEVETFISGVWQEVLGIKDIGIKDNFFDIGGNSLKVIRVTSKLSEIFKKEIPVTTMFTYPTIRSLARFLTGDIAATESTASVDNRNKFKKEITDNKVAVIGMAGRFPGAKNIGEFWRNLKEGVESITFFSEEELKTLGIPDEILGNSNYVKAKGVLEGVEYFDASFFNYTKKEAELMDPQLRILHECTWEAIESAGYEPGIEDFNVGIYLGASSNFPWLRHISERGGNSLEEFAALILNEKDFFSTRLAYKMNLKGPAITMQTACSTSMVSICKAYEDIIAGRCEMAVAGGIGLTYPHKGGYTYYDGMVFSPDGHCKAFSSNSKGTVPGNGVGIVVLKPLAEAINDRDTIYAVIKGAAINNDGLRKIGYTAPSVEGQVEVIRSAMDMAGVKSEDISFVETHGTATELGDLVEIEALKQVFNTDKRNFCRIGAVKTNIGHLDSASGAAGFIKTVLSLKNRIIPPILHFDKPNPKIDFENSPFQINSECIDLSHEERILSAGVSSFGIGGTNAHMILEEPPTMEKDDKGRNWRLLLLSAKTETALQSMSIRLRDWLRENPEAQLSDVAYTLQTGRKSFEYRKMLVCDNSESAIELLDSSSKVGEKFCSENKNPKIIFMFSGIGAQYINMGRQLYESEKIFKGEVDKCFNIYKEITKCNLKTFLYTDRECNENVDTALESSEINQPIIFIFEYALAQLMIQWGVKPDAMIGYSFGEYVAACISGVFSLENALELVILRGKLIEETDRGAMLSVPLPESEVRPLLTEGLWLAISNGPTCIVSGREDLIINFEKQMRNKKCVCVRLKARHALHSPMMEYASKILKEKIKTLELEVPNIPYISNVTGTWITVEDATDPKYWAKHLCSTVRFADGMNELLTNDNSILVEIGANRDLCVLARHFIKDISKTTVLNLVKGPQEKLSDVSYLLNRVGQLWLNGRTPNWMAFYKDEKRNRIMLPTYPFERKMYMPWGKGVIGVNCRTNTENPPMLEKRKDIKKWFYAPVWERDLFQLDQEYSVENKKKFLIFCDELYIGSKLKEELEKHGNEIVCVKKGEPNYSLVKEKSLYYIRPEEEDYTWLFDQLMKSNSLPDVIIHLWGVKKEDQGLCEEKLKETLEDCYYSLLYIAKEIGGREPNKEVKINIVINEMHEVTGDEFICPEKAVVMGPYNTIAMEYPKIKCNIIDISTPVAEDKVIKRTVLQLTSEILSDFKENIIAYRGKYRWIQNYKEYPVEARKIPKETLRDNGVYLITGGLGGIGIVLAEYIAQKVKGRLILVGRSPFPKKEEWDEWLANHGDTDKVSAKILKFKHLEDSGAKLLVYSADISNQEQMEKVIEDAQNKFGAFNGIIHAAGTSDGGMIHLRTKQMSEDVFSPKIRGTMVLENIFRDKQLDFFILCSSLSSVLWTIGQVAYCAANAFENSFAYYWNRRKGSTASSIAWDTWLEVGMAVESVSRLKGQGANKSYELDMLNSGIYPLEGIEVFKKVLEIGMIQAVISTRELDYIIHESYSKGTTVSLDSLKITSSTEVHNSRPVMIYEYTAPISEIEHSLANIFREYFGIEKIGVEDNLFDFGASSLDIIRLNDRLKETINLDIPVVTMFRYPTIRLLASHIHGDIGGEASQDEGFERAEQVQHGKRNLNNRLKMKKVGKSE